MNYAARDDAMNKWARYVNAVLGVWLIIAPFIWTHTYGHALNSWIVGGLVVLFALIATAQGWVRYLNSALAVWLFISIWALPQITTATAWNNGLVAIAILAFSLIPNVYEPRRVGTGPVRQTV